MSVAAWPVWLSAARRRVVGAAGRAGTGVGRKALGALRSPWAAVRPALHVAMADYSAAVDGRATIVELTDFAPQKEGRNYESSISRRLETTRSGASVSWRTRSEGGDAGAAGPHALGERPLRHQLELDLARLDLLLDRRRPRRVGGERGDHLSDEPCFRQELRRERPHAGRVEDDRQVACTVVAQREEQAVGPALHDAEAAE